MQIELINQSARNPTDLLRANQGPVEYSEETLVAEAQSGSPGAFRQLVERYHARLFRRAQKMVQCREDAEEITQNAFFKAFTHLAQFRGQSRFYTWLVRIAINEGLMKARARRPREISIDERVEGEEPIRIRDLEDGAPNPEERCSQRELLSSLANAICRLSTALRLVLELRDIRGFSIRETARTLDISATAVKSRLRRARVQLRESLTQCPRQSSGKTSASYRTHPLGRCALHWKTQKGPRLRKPAELKGTKVADAPRKTSHRGQALRGVGAVASGSEGASGNPTLHTIPDGE